MRLSIRWLALTLLAGLAAFPGLAQEEASSLAEALAEGKVSLSLRYRYEAVSEDAFSDDAQASTLRTALGYRTKPLGGWSLFFEAEDVTDIGAEDRHSNAGAGSLGNRVVGRPVVADPDLTEINQAYLRGSWGETSLQLGRFELNLADQRLVGAVGWRQNHQSFDGAKLEASPFARTTFTYAFLANANRIFGDRKAMASHLLQGAVELGDAGTLRLYGLALDYDDPRDARLSTLTWGAEFAGRRELAGGIGVLYEVEAALQGDHGDNPAAVDAGYLHLVVGGAFPRVTARLGWEVLEGAPGDGAFSTPLATLHKFNGWADKLLATPTRGLEDLYLQLQGDAGSIGWLATYHDFSAESVGLDYGTELDLQLTWKAPWRQTFALKAALYDAGALSTDTEKWMVWTAYAF